MFSLLELVLRSLVRYPVESGLGLFSGDFGLGQPVLDPLVVGRRGRQRVKRGEIAQKGVCGRDLCHGIGIVVVDCGGHWKPVLPFVLLRVGGEAEELLYPLVLSLREAIRLGVEGHRDVLLDL